jgi:hypothetical protein
VFSIIVESVLPVSVEVHRTSALSSMEDFEADMIVVFLSFNMRRKIITIAPRLTIPPITPPAITLAEENFTAPIFTMNFANAGFHNAFYQVLATLQTLICTQALSVVLARFLCTVTNVLVAHLIAD